MQEDKSFAKAQKIADRWYPPDQVADIVERSKAQCQRRGGDMLTAEDWDAAVDEDDAPAVMSSRYLPILDKMMRR